MGRLSAPEFLPRNLQFIRGHAVSIT